MIILNQNRDEFVNFENIMCVNITDCQEDGFLISAGFIVGRDDNYRELGYYKTEERAKEVLVEVCIAYANMESIKIPGIRVKEDITNVMLLSNICYEMPKE